jgi:hypothetical protein
LSSILTALKKLENKDFHPEEVGSLSHKHLIGRKKPKGTVFRASAWGGNSMIFCFIVMFTGLLGIIGWTHHKNQSPVAVVPESEPVPVAETQPPKQIPQAIETRSPVTSMAVKQDTETPPLQTPVRENDPIAGQISESPVTIMDASAPAHSGSFTLQAIAWAKEPPKRMAVINGEVVRQGDVVKGVFVNQINENDVVLKKGDLVWRLIFPLR